MKIENHYSSIQKILTIGFLVILMVGTFPSSVLAVVRWHKDDDPTNPNILNVSGTCDGQEVTIYLYVDNSDNPVYSAGEACTNGTFHHVEDLTQWHLPPGTYKTVVGEGIQSKDTSHTEDTNINGSAGVATQPNSQENPDNAFSRALTSFSLSLKSLENSFEDMKDSIDSTSMGGPIKAGLSGILSLMEFPISQLHDFSDKMNTQYAAQSTTTPDFQYDDTEGTGSAQLNPDVTPSVASSSGQL